MKDNKKVVVGLSGGVDSSVSLVLLKKQGYQPIGVSFKYPVWKNRKNQLKENVCCSEKSFAIAREVCRRLGVEHHIVDDTIDFKDKVMGYFLKTLKEKKTPNPCLICNRLVKFRSLVNFAKEKNAQYIATGHYARVEKNKKSGLYELLRAKDKKKDQSYFLALLGQKELSKTIFPLGEYTKEKVYQIAKKEGLYFFEKTRQSQDLCFVSGKSIPFYLEEKLGFEPGKIVDTKGNILGEHQGLYFYTIGQRKGINLSGLPAGKAGGPWYVIGFDKKKNWLIISREEKDLFQKEVILEDFSFTSGQEPKKAIKVMAKTRYNQELSPAKLNVRHPMSNTLRLVFEQKQKAITPGQWAVFYLPAEASAKVGGREVCLGGGAIK